MTLRDYSEDTASSQTMSQLQQFQLIFSNLDDRWLLRQLRLYRWTGRTGHPLRGLWRAYVCTFLLNMRSTNDLIRELEQRPDLRILCGLYTLPSRSTFNRFIRRLSHHTDLVEQVFTQLTNKLKALLPNLGREVAVDSTAVRTHSNGNPDPASDADATWAYKNSASSRGGKVVYYFGYKLHMVADANCGVPLAQYVTTGSRSDNPELRNIIVHAERMLPWFKPNAVIADRGYDASYNHEYLWQKGILPIIHIRKNAQSDLYNGIYTTEGVPTCIGQVPMQYVRSDPKRGHLYRCVGCHLASRKGVHYCNDEVWEHPKQNLRLFGAIRRNGPEWKELYAKRQAVERVFKGMKESRRLERHCVRGMHHIKLHTMMSALTFQVTALVALQQGRASDMRWMVKRVA